MKIPPTSPGSIQGGKTTEAADSGRAKASAGTNASVPASAGSASVQLSQLSTQLHAIESSLSGPEFDQAKVEEIKQAIRDGSLSVNPEVVADKMLASAQELLAKGLK